MLSGRSAEGVRSVETGHRRNAGFAMHLPAYGPNRLRPELPGKGARLVVAPRVLVDATAVPADRGALGRYVDGLVIALEAAGADLAVACQRADEERYGRLVPGARVVAGPTAIAHRPARLAWEQSGLPLVAQQLNADVIHAPHYSMPLRPGAPTVVTIHDLTYFTEPDAHNPVSATFFKSAIRTSTRRATRTPPGSTSPTTAWIMRRSTGRARSRSARSPTGLACTASGTWPISVRWSRARTFPI